MTAALDDLRKGLHALLDAALAALRSPELEQIPLEAYSAAVLMGAPPTEGRALRRLDRVERMTAAGG